MNPIAVSATPAGKVMPGVAETAAAGTAAPSSLADLFCQMLATVQAGASVAAEGGEPQSECADGECSATETGEVSTDTAAMLAAALGTTAPKSTMVSIPEEMFPVEPFTLDGDPVSVQAVPVDVVVDPEGTDATEHLLAPVPADAVEDAAPPAMTLAMQAALARAGLGEAAATVTARRFGDAGVPLARPVQAVDAAPGDGATPSLRELADSQARVTAASVDTSETGDETGGASTDAFKSAANPSTMKSGEFAATTFDVNTGLFGGADVQAASRARTEPVTVAPQPNVPRSVSVREVGDVVVRSVHFLSGRTEDVVTVRLVPQSLGELRIAVHSGERGMEVVLTAANNAARDALEHNLVGLREALGREGMNVERVSVQVFAPFDAGHQPASGHQSQQHGGASQSARQPNTAYRESSDSPPQHQGNNEQQPRRQQHAGRLNMWV